MVSANHRTLFWFTTVLIYKTEIIKMCTKIVPLSVVGGFLPSQMAAESARVSKMDSRE